MEKIIFRKFFYDLISFFLIVSLSLSLITWIIQSVNYLDFISKDGHGFQVYFAFVSLNFPKIFSKLIIFSYFISLFFVIQKYQANNEILIFWTNGIGKLKLIHFIIKISVIITIIQIILVYFLVPKSQDYSRDFIRTSNIDLFTSLITEKKFVDTVKNFTIFVENIDENGNFENIFLKDSINSSSTQIISAKSGKIIEQGSNKFLNLNYGQILDITDNDFRNTKVIKFNNTIFNLTNLKTKSTTIPKLQELNSKILLNCINQFFLGNKEQYFLTNFTCSTDSALKSFKELFNRSIKPFYILVLGLFAALIVFISDKNPKNVTYKFLIFFIGVCFIVVSELNSQFINYSILNNLFLILIPFLLFVFTYLFAINLYRKSN